MAKKKDTKNKKMYYRRAILPKGEKRTLQSLLESAHGKLDTVGKRTFASGQDSEIRGADYKVEQGLYLQVASYVPDEATSTIEKNGGVKSSKIEAASAPVGRDYLDGDIFAFVKGNHVILCPSGARETTFVKYVKAVLHKVGEDVLAAQIDIDKIAKADKVKMIKEEGVKEVLLDASLYEASRMHIDAKSVRASGIPAALAEQLKRIFSEDKTLKEIKENENLNIKISIQFDGREAQKHVKEVGFGDAGKMRLAKTAQQIIEDVDDGFSIVTGAGNTITAEEIRVFETTQIAILGKSLARDSAYSALKWCYNQWQKAGVLNE